MVRVKEISLPHFFVIKSVNSLLVALNDSAIMCVGIFPEATARRVNHESTIVSAVNNKHIVRNGSLYWFSADRCLSRTNMNVCNALAVWTACHVVPVELFYVRFRRRSHSAAEACGLVLRFGFVDVTPLSLSHLSTTGADQLVTVMGVDSVRGWCSDRDGHSQESDNLFHVLLPVAVVMVFVMVATVVVVVIMVVAVVIVFVLVIILLLVVFILVFGDGGGDRCRTNTNSRS